MNVKEKELEWARARARRRERLVKELINILRESAKRVAEIEI